MQHGILIDGRGGRGGRRRQNKGKLTRDGTIQYVVQCEVLGENYGGGGGGGDRIKEN